VNPHNPCATPTATRKAKGDAQRVEESDSKFSRFVRILIRPPVFLSLFAVVHFGGSILFWSLGALILIRMGSNVAAWISLIWAAAPAVILFVLSITNLVRSFRARRFTTITIIGIYLISICLFWYDVSNERSQIQVGIATAKCWENGGSKNTYFAWWWFNDGWFR
jgi:hypothetical protein